MTRETIFSADRTYRYALWRCAICRTQACSHWLEGPYVQWIGLNPSTADERINDPTVRRCVDYTHKWGYQTMVMTNLFGFRATDPDAMMDHGETIAAMQDNARTIAELAKQAELIVCGWGNHGKHIRRAAKVVDHMRNVMGLHLYCLGQTKMGEPKHPLYLRADLRPVPFDV